MSNLVLGLFSGVGSLDEGFRRAGYCVISAGDVAWSSLYDLRHFRPPPGVLEGIIGGDPCQSHSALANLVRAKGLEPSFPDLTPEFLRVIEEARPRWFLRENVPRAPEIKPAGYDVASFMLDHSALDSGDGIGHRQIRKRRFWFGVRDGSAPELRAHLVFALSPAQEPAKSLCGDSRSSFIPGGQAEVDAIKRGETVQREKSDVRYSLDNMLDLQGLPRDIFEHSPLTMGGKRKLIGNAVPLPMAEALACAVRDSMEQP